MRSGYGEAGLHFRKETGRGNSKRKGTSDTALYPVLFSWNRERGTSGNQSRKMCIHTGQECWVEKPLIGICEEDSFTNGEYQMILNPAILGGV